MSKLDMDIFRYQFFEFFSSNNINSNSDKTQQGNNQTNTSNNTQNNQANQNNSPIQTGNNQTQQGHNQGQGNTQTSQTNAGSNPSNQAQHGLGQGNNQANNQTQQKHQGQEQKQGNNQDSFPNHNNQINTQEERKNHRELLDKAMGIVDKLGAENNKSSYNNNQNQQNGNSVGTDYNNAGNSSGQNNITNQTKSNKVNNVDLVNGQTNNNQQAPETKESIIKKANESANRVNRKSANSSGSLLLANETSFENWKKDNNKKLKKFYKTSGIGSGAALTGMVIGGLLKYKSAVDRWKLQAQQSIAMRRPVPRKPSFTWHALTGGLGGAIAGSVGGNVLKLTGIGKSLDANFKEAQLKNKIENNQDEFYNLVRNNNISKNAYIEEKNKAAKLHAETLFRNRQKGLSVQNKDDIRWLENMVRTDSGINYLRRLLGDNSLEDYEIVDYFLAQNFSNKEFYNLTVNTYNLNYKLNKCFSDLKKIEDIHNIKMEKVLDIYCFNNTLNEFLPMTSFIEETLLYGPDYLNYVCEDITKKELVNFHNINVEENDYTKYIYNRYINLFSIPVDYNEFCYKFNNFSNYKPYILTKIAYKDRINFANSIAEKTTELNIKKKPNTVVIDDSAMEDIKPEVNNKQYTENYHQQKATNLTQNDLNQNEKYVDKKNKELEKQKRDQDKISEAHANTSNNIKDIEAKALEKEQLEKDKISKINEQLNINPKMDPSKRSQLQQEMTNRRLNIQQIISSKNDKKESALQKLDNIKNKNNFY